MTKAQHHHHIPKTLENAGEFRMFIYELTESRIFSVSILFVILLNTVILVIQTDEAFAVKAGKVFKIAVKSLWILVFLYCDACRGKNIESVMNGFDFPTIII